MSFTAEQAHQFHRDCEKVRRGLQDLKLKIVVQGQPLDITSRVREHLLHGVGRRIGVIKRSIENIFSLFPPETARPIDLETIADVQINLHAFVMNLYGIWDNWAWAFVLRHNLEIGRGDRRRISLFNDAMRARLPSPLRNYLSSSTMIEWHEQYAKYFRDALAHRIPPYLPPARFTREEGKHYNELEDEKVECIKAAQWERLDQIYIEQANIGSPCFSFLHAYTEDTPAKLIMLHPQVLCDGMTVVEFGELFLTHWEEVA
jgi:hypothetical protein